MNENNSNTYKTSAVDAIPADATPVREAVDEYNGATVTLPLAKLLQIVEERVEAKILCDNWATKYWLLYAENEELKKKLQALEGKS